MVPNYRSTNGTIWIDSIVLSGDQMLLEQLKEWIHRSDHSWEQTIVLVFLIIVNCKIFIAFVQKTNLFHNE